MRQARPSMYALAFAAVAACGGATRVLVARSVELQPGSAAALAPVAPAPTAAPVARLASAGPGFTAADVHFMSGMIVHHAQAVLIAGWAPSHGASATVRTLCERIVVSQNDEIAMMQRWLRERGQVVPSGDPHAGPQMMPGMDHPMVMPGMLSPEQLAQLDAARGPEFDRLFLKFMIQHHQGALTMVTELLGTQGAAQDGALFKFATDVNADQTVEIDRMSRMLAALP
ncbi:MAG TPA: DUF305 domain-containing protein [Gemmatimonadales bacterium]|nr:DUF305 domain-containing protein [Gemmatimonadales bacterium]